MQYTKIIIEQLHDKTNEMTGAASEVGIRPVWSESSLCAQWVAKTQRFFMRTAETWIRLRVLRLYIIIITMIWSKEILFIS